MAVKRDHAQRRGERETGFEPLPAVKRVPVMALHTEMEGFAGPADNSVLVENRKTGTGVRVTADRPLARMTVWSIRPTRCPEPFINVKVEPGSEFTWRISYEFYTK
jgi:hypothetical protein